MTRRPYPADCRAVSEAAPLKRSPLHEKHVALGARMVEKHFTDDLTRTGPDHAFSMDPRTWREMVDRTRELENALGTGIKKVEDNERETVVLQRRSVRARVALAAGSLIVREQLEALRPCPAGAIEPYRLPELVGRTARRAIAAGEHLRWTDVE